MSDLPRILFVDDDAELCKLIRSQIDTTTYCADFAGSAEAASKKLTERSYDLLVLDIMMPGMSGLKFASRVRKQYPYLPIIFLTAQNEFHYKAEGFEAGAEDYISKPFNFMELMYRIKALFRRMGMPIVSDVKHCYDIGAYKFDSSVRKLEYREEVRTLSMKEAELLQILCSNLNAVVTREEFLRKVWGKTDEFTIDSMDVYLTRLRKHLKNDPSVKIENIRGTGFKLSVE